MLRRVWESFEHLGGLLVAAFMGCVIFALLGCGSGQARGGKLSPPSTRERTPEPSQRCRAHARLSATVEPTWVFRNLEFRTPVGLVQAPPLRGQSSGRWYLLDQHGSVHSFFENDAGEAVEPKTTDLGDRVYVNERWLGEVGLLGIALHPRFARDPRVFLAYMARTKDLVLRVSSFVDREGSLDPKSEVVLLEVPEPYENHNGGHLAFGPDGHLYIGSGDGGAAGDPHGNGQNTHTLLGAILRVDVDRKSPGLTYGIVQDNPFANGGGRPEIFAYGLRNPWRFSFDRETGELWTGDVGQDRWEEVNRVVLGGNYGWNVREGHDCFPAETATCADDGFVDPYFVYEHPAGNPRSISGGFVYRGSRLPELVGRYVFGDYETGTVSALVMGPGDTPPQAVELSKAGLQASAFAESAGGELYVLDYGGNRVLRLDPGRPSQPLPALLSETGCVDPADPRRLTQGAIPYDVAVPFWSDGAEKQRYLFLPEATTLSVLPDGDLEVPRGTVIVKNFSHQGRLFETRFYVRHDDGEYSGYSYAWRDDGKDAELVASTRAGRVGDLDWIFPGPEACNQCHTAAAGRTLGLERGQLAVAGQIGRLVEAGALSGAAAATLGAVEPFSTTHGSLEARARVYLHVNCSGCHRPQGPGRGTLDLRYQVPLAGSGLCEPSALSPRASPSVDETALLVPGHARESALFQRLSQRGLGSMPPLATRKVDTKGAALIAEWIQQRSDCPRSE